MFNHAQSEVICPRLVQRIVETRCALTRTAIEAMHGLVSDQGLDESLSAWACRNIPRGTCPSLQVRVSRTFDANAVAGSNASLALETRPLQGTRSWHRLRHAVVQSSKT